MFSIRFKIGKLSWDEIIQIEKGLIFYNVHKIS